MNNFYFCSPSEREIVTKMVFFKNKIEVHECKINIKSE